MKKKAINLLQKRGAPPTFWERMYDWMTNTCRIIVIITEAFVLVAFGWRFVLELQLGDLDDEIEIKGEQLRSLTSQEDEIRLLQSKIGAYKYIWNNGSNFTPVLSEVNSYIPVGVSDLVVGIGEHEEGRSLHISGEVERESLSSLENKLKDSDYFSDVFVSDMDQLEGEEWAFSLLARIIYNQKRSPLSQDENSESSS